MTSCNCDAGLYLRNKPLDAFTREYPNLAQVDDMLGCATQWIEVQYTQLLLSLPPRVCPTDSQISESAKVMRSVFAPYTVAEILLFFAKLRTGDYPSYDRGSAQEILEIFKSKFLPLRQELTKKAHDILEAGQQAKDEAAKMQIWHEAELLGLTEVTAIADKEKIRNWIDTRAMPEVMRDTFNYLYNKKYGQNSN